MSASRQPKDDRIYQLKVTLKGSRPPIWRRLMVPARTRLHDLHDILQIAMGWTDSHMHQFIAGRVYYGMPHEMDFAETRDEIKFSLSDVLSRAKAKFVYEYDFGDGWQHDVVLEKILEKDSGVTYPCCVAGERACPPEDCGGLWGFYDKLELLKDPEDPEYEELREWWGDEFVEEAFDAAAVNKSLTQWSKAPRVWRPAM